MVVGGCQQRSREAKLPRLAGERELAVFQPFISGSLPHVRADGRLIPSLHEAEEVKREVEKEEPLL